MRRSRWATLPLVRRMVEGLSAASILASAASSGGGSMASVVAAHQGAVIRPLVPARPSPEGVDRPVAGPAGLSATAVVNDRVVGRHLPHPGVLEHVVPVSYSTPAPQGPSPANGFAGLGPGTKVYVVQPGDCLSVIAQDHLGDWHLDTEIHALNVGRLQPDGRSLTDDHWIYVGWVLVMPANAVGVEVVPPHPQTLAAPARPVPTTTPKVHAAPPETTQHAEPTRVPMTTPAPSNPSGGDVLPGKAGLGPTGSQEAAAPRAVPPSEGHHGPGRRGEGVRTSEKSPIGPIVGVTGLVAAGVMWRLRRRRGQQMHFRRRGRSVVQNAAAVGAAETKARAIADEEAMRWVDAGLRHLGEQLG